MHAAADCIFCKIISGDVPCHRVYENDRVLAFLDVGPLSLGHTLVIPKTHAVTLAELSEDDAAACMRAISRISPAVAQTVGAKAWNVLQNNGHDAGQVVKHVHFHIIPRAENDSLGFRWPAGRLDNDKGKALAAQIAKAVQ